DAAALLHAEAEELPGRAVRIEAVDPLPDQPFDVAAEFRFIDLAGVVQRDQIGGEDPAQPFRHETLPVRPPSLPAPPPGGSRSLSRESARLAPIRQMR